MLIYVYTVRRETYNVLAIRVGALPTILFVNLKIMLSRHFVLWKLCRGALAPHLECLVVIVLLSTQKEANTMAHFM